MPLHILVPMVVVGIALIALITHWLGLSRARTLRDAAEACAAWDREAPDTPAVSATLSADGHAALIETADGRGLVWVMGADTAARPLAGAAAVPAPDGLIVRFPDFGAPEVRIRLDAQSRPESWHSLLTHHSEAQPT